MTPLTPPSRPWLKNVLPLAAGVLCVAAFLILPGSASSGSSAVITVTFTGDDMGFTATSTKDLSNIIVELCDGSIHKHDGLTGPTYVHTETGLIAGVWVKSGNNGIGGSAPPGAGERFDNLGVDCDVPTPTCGENTTCPPPTCTQDCETGTTTSSSTTSSSPSTSGTSSTESTTSTESSTSTESTTSTESSSTTQNTTTTPTTEVPFFPSSTALVLGVAGALGGVALMLRRRL